MKPFKNILFSAMLTLGAFGAVTYTACNKDECKNVTCQNGGTCSGGNCNCPAGYEGDRCQDKSNAKYAGNYTAVEQGSTTPYPVTISIDPTNPSKVLVENLGDYGCSTGGNIIFSGTTGVTTLTIDDTKCGYHMTSTLNYNNAGGVTTLTGSYTVTFLGNSESYGVTLTKNP